MRTQSCRSARALWLLGLTGVLLLSVAPGSPAGAVSVTKAMVVEAVRKRTVFMGDLAGLPQEKRGKFLDALGLSALADEVFPNAVAVRSQADAHAILGGVQLILNRDRPAYNRVVLKKKLMDTRILLEMTRRLPAVSEAQRQLLLRQMDQLLTGARESMVKHLGNVVPRDRIVQYTTRIRGQWAAGIDHPTTCAMKQPMEPGAVDHILKVFEARLAKTAHRAAKKLSVAVPDERLREMVIETILDEVLSPLSHQVMKRTTPEGLRAVRADDIVPGYSEVLRQLSQHQREFMQEQLAKQRARVEEFQRRMRENTKFRD